MKSDEYGATDQPRAISNRSTRPRESGVVGRDFRPQYSQTARSRPSARVMVFAMALMPTTRPD